MSRSTIDIVAIRLQRLFRKLFYAAGRRTGPHETRIFPYRGYGSHKEIYLMGRVFSRTTQSTLAGDTLKDRLAAVAGRILRTGASGVHLKASIHGSEQKTISDKDGYFRFHMRLQPPLPAAEESLWHDVTLMRADGDPEDATRAEVLVPPKQARTLIISDIDDTVIFTGVANKLKMLYRLFVQGPHSRVAFPGTAALYRALHRGPTGDACNPILYVSRGPWSIYEIIDAFFNLHRIPAGPVLFLREWGMSWRNPLPRRSKYHKARLIRTMLALYKDFECVLIGDSGQHDPEIYAQMVDAHPGRIKAVYIRNVSRSRERVDAIKALAEKTASQGCALVLAADSFIMARHMAEAGLIAPSGLAAVLRERDRDAAAGAAEEIRRVTRPDREQTREAVEHGELERELDRDKKTNATPPNVIVERESGASDRP